MAYFTKDFIDFFSELEKNNNKTWFDENRKRYDGSVKQPFYNFIEEMIVRLQQLDAHIQISPKDAIFRINRDIRFSKDKTPYKTQASALITPGGKKDMTSPGYYLEFQASRIRMYGGIYMVDAKTLHRVRMYISEHLQQFNKLIADADFKKKFGKILGEQNKRLPKELETAAEKQPLLLNKQFYYFSELELKHITSEKLTETIFNIYKSAEAVRKFLSKALGN